MYIQPGFYTELFKGMADLGHDREMERRQYESALSSDGFTIASKTHGDRQLRIKTNPTAEFYYERLVDVGNFIDIQSIFNPCNVWFWK